MTLSDDCAVDLLADMLRIPSRCGREDRVAGLLLETMRDAGFDAHRDRVGNVIGTIGPGMQRDGTATGARRAVILGHMDTVPGAIAVEQRDGALFGRGAVDAKGPLATAIVAASRAAERAGVEVTVIGAVQEEGPSMGARHLAGNVHERPVQPPDYLVIAEPSGWDAVVLGYKGSQRFTVQIRQPCGHTAGPGPTAPEVAVAFWNDLVAWCAAQTAHLASARRGGAALFHSLTPTLISMTSRSDGLEDFAYLHIGLRLPPGVTPEEVQAGVRALLPDAMFRFAAGEPAVRGEKSGPLVASFLRAIRSEGGEPRFKLKTGTSDMNIVGPAWGCPMLAYGPGDSALDHRPDEHIQVDEYLCGIRVLARALEEL